MRKSGRDAFEGVLMDICNYIIGLSDNSLGIYLENISIDLLTKSNKCFIFLNRTFVWYRIYGYKEIESYGT